MSDVRQFVERSDREASRDLRCHLNAAAGVLETPDERQRHLGGLVRVHPAIAVSVAIVE
jgi:hypothetical protein